MLLVPSVFGARIIDEGFENPGYEESWSETNGTYINDQASHPGTAPEGTGSYCLRLNKSSDDLPYTFRDEGNSRGEFYVHFWLYVDTAVVTQGEHSLLFGAFTHYEQPNYPTAGIDLENYNGSYYLLPAGRTAQWTWSYGTRQAINFNTWYCVEMHCNLSTGEYECWLDGTQWYSGTMSFYASTVRHYGIGFANLPASHRFDAYFDNFIVDNSDRVACESGPSVPGQVTLSSPSNNAIMRDTSLTMTWRAVADADTYHVQISRHSSFTNFAVNDSNRVDTTRLTNGLQKATHYYWRARAKNEGGWGSWSATWGFNTRPDTTMPSGDTTSPTGTPRVVFLHHSTGGYLLADSGRTNGGGFGQKLRARGFRVYDVNYSAYNRSFSPPQNSGISDSTDIGNWYGWFADTTTQGNSIRRRDNIMGTVFSTTNRTSEYGAYDTLTGAGTDSNRIVLFKSCYPNSDIYDSNSTAPTDLYNRLYNYTSSGTNVHTLSNIKAVYNRILGYFKVHPEKMFVVITQPPLSSSNTTAARAANARALADWLYSKWLQDSGWTNKNVFVFDYYNVLTDTANHHRYVNGTIQHITVANSGNNLVYPSTDDHPSAAGQLKAANELAPLLSAWYSVWQDLGPVITSPPVRDTVTENDSASFSVVSSGSNLTYQWQRNGTNVGTNSASYKYLATRSNDNDSVRVIVSNSGGADTSDYVKLLVLYPHLFYHWPMTEGSGDTLNDVINGLDVHAMHGHLAWGNERIFANNRTFVADWANNIDSTDRVAGSADTLRGNLDTFTISVLLNQYDIQRNGTILRIRSTTDSRDGFVLLNWDNEIRMEVRPGGTQHVLATRAQMPAGKWVLLQIVKTDVVRAYINNVLTATIDADAALNGYVRIGAYDTSAALRQFLGTESVSDLRIYNYGLDSAGRAEILSGYGAEGEYRYLYNGASFAGMLRYAETDGVFLSRWGLSNGRYVATFNDSTCLAGLVKYYPPDQTVTWHHGSLLIPTAFDANHEFGTNFRIIALLDTLRLRPDSAARTGIRVGIYANHTIDGDSVRFGYAVLGVNEIVQFQAQNRITITKGVWHNYDLYVNTDSNTVRFYWDDTLRFEYTGVTIGSPYLAYHGLFQGVHPQLDGDSLYYDNVYIGESRYASGPVISVQPSSVTVCDGSLATFSLTASGAGTLAYQWMRERDGSSTTVGSNSPTYSTYTGEDGDSVWCVVTDSNGSTVTNKVLIYEYDCSAYTGTWTSTSSTDANDVDNYSWYPPIPPTALDATCSLRFIDTTGTEASATFGQNTTVKTIQTVSGYAGNISWSGYTLTCESFNFADNGTLHMGNGVVFSSSRKRSTIASTVGTVTSTSCTLFVSGPRDSLNDAKGQVFARLRLAPSSSYYQWGSNNTTFLCANRPIWAEGGASDTVVLGAVFNVKLNGSGDFIYQPSQMVWTADASYILWFRFGASNIRGNLPATTYTFSNTQIAIAPDASAESDSVFFTGNITCNILNIAFSNSNVRTPYFNANGYNITANSTLYCGTNQATTAITKWGSGNISAAAVDFSSYNGGTNRDSMETSKWTVAGNWSRGSTHTFNWQPGSQVTFTNTASITGGMTFRDVIINAAARTVTTPDSVRARTVFVTAGARTGTWKYCGINSVTPSMGNPGGVAVIRGAWNDTTGLAVRFGSQLATKIAQSDRDSTVQVLIPTVTGTVSVSVSQSAYADTLVNGFTPRLTIAYANSPAIAYINTSVAYPATVLYDGSPVTPDSTKITTGSLSAGLLLSSGTGAIAGTPTIFKATYDSVTVTAYYGSSSNSTQFKILVTKVGRDTVVASGNWTSASIWSLGRKPADGDTVCQYAAHNTVMDSNFTVGKVHILSTGNFSMNGRELTTTAGGLVDRGSGTRDLGNKIRIMGANDSLVFGKNIGAVTSTLCNYEFGGTGHILYRTSKRMRIKSLTVLEGAKVEADSVLEDTTFGTPALDIANNSGCALTMQPNSQLVIHEPGGYGSGIEQFGFWALSNNQDVYSIHPTADLVGAKSASSFFGITTGGGNVRVNLPTIRAYGLTFNIAVFANATTGVLTMTGPHYVGNWETWFGDNYATGIRDTLYTNGYNITAAQDSTDPTHTGWMLLTAFQTPSHLYFSSSTVTIDSLLTTIADSSVNMNLERSQWYMTGGMALTSAFKINRGTSTFNFLKGTTHTPYKNRFYNVNVNAPGETVAIAAGDTMYCRIRNVIAGSAAGAWVMCGVTAPRTYTRLGEQVRLTGQWTDSTHLTVRIGDSTRTATSVSSTGATITLPTRITRNGVQVRNDYIVVGTTLGNMVDSATFVFDVRKPIGRPQGSRIGLGL